MKVDLMHISPKDLEELRSMAGDPSKVLRWCDRMEFQTRVVDRDKTVEWLQTEQGRTLEEAERIVSYWVAGGSYLMERARCHACKGWGYGSYGQDCYKCDGERLVIRFSLPPEEWQPGGVV